MFFAIFLFRLLIICIVCGCGYLIYKKISDTPQLKCSKTKKLQEVKNQVRKTEEEIEITEKLTEEEARLREAQNALNVEEQILKLKKGVKDGKDNEV